MRQFVIGWWESMQDAKLTGKKAFTRFLLLFPNKFEVLGSGPCGNDKGFEAAIVRRFVLKGAALNEDPHDLLTGAESEG